MLFFGSNSSNQFVIRPGLFDGILSASKFNTILSSSISIIVSMSQNVFCLLNSYGKEKKLTFCNFFHASSFATLVAHQFLLSYVPVMKGFKSLHSSFYFWKINRKEGEEGV